MKNILVTGGAGFIGSHVVRRHLEKGDRVWAVDNLLTGRKHNLQEYTDNPSLRFEEADITEWPQLGDAVKWADHIYHMAAILGQRLVLSDPVNTLSKNIHSCEIILEAMSKQDKKNNLLIASSSGVYAQTTTNPDEKLKETAMLKFPSGAFLQESYYLSKLVNEVTGLSYLHQKKVRCTIARIFNTIGTKQTGRYGMVVPNFIDQATKNIPITVFGDGLQMRSFCNVLDTVEALDLLVANPESDGEIVNVGNNEECSIIELANLIKEKAKSSSEIHYIPYKEAYGVDFHDVLVRKPNIEKLHRLTGFQPKWTLEKTIDWILSSRKNT